MNSVSVLCKRLNKYLLGQLSGQRTQFSAQQDKAPGMLLSVLIACSVGGEGPAAPGSPAAEEVAAVEKIQAQAAEIKELAGDLEGLTDTARRAEEGEARDTVIEQMRILMADIDTKNAALQADVAALEARLHASAGDQTLSAPPTEE